MAAERNAPCPCGSGLKYKKCCLNNGVTAPKKLLGITPAELVGNRVEAFRRNDFGFIYDTYHPESNFRLQFPSRSDYIKYGQATLDKDYRINSCDILQHRQLNETRAQVLFFLSVHYQRQDLEYFELSEFHLHQGQWYYLESHRLERAEFSGSVEEITYEKMEQSGICF